MTTLFEYLSFFGASIFLFKVFPIYGFTSLYYLQSMKGVYSMCLTCLRINLPLTQEKLKRLKMYSKKINIKTEK
jgi:hypothetical protein